MGQGDRRLPDLAAGTDTEPTYPLGAIAQPFTAVHQAGARVAIHPTLPGAGRIVAAGIDSIEHGFGLDERAITDMPAAEFGARLRDVLAAG